MVSSDSKIRFIKIKETELARLQLSEGQFIICTDTKNIYYDALINNSLQRLDITKSIKIDIDELDQKIENYNISALQKAINDEIAARKSADSALQTAINNEKTARENADNTLRNSIGGIDSRLQILERASTDMFVKRFTIKMQNIYETVGELALGRVISDSRNIYVDSEYVNLDNIYKTLVGSIETASRFYINNYYYKYFKKEINITIPFSNDYKYLSVLSYNVKNNNSGVLNIKNINCEQTGNNLKIIMNSTFNDDMNYDYDYPYSASNSKIVLIPPDEILKATTIDNKYIIEIHSGARLNLLQHWPDEISIDVLFMGSGFINANYHLTNQDITV